MKKYLFIFTAIFGMALTSCNNDASKETNNEVREIITQKKLCEGIWITAALYFPNADMFMPITDKDNIAGLVFFSDGDCAICFGGTEERHTMTYSIDKNVIMLKGTSKNILVKINGYNGDYLDVSFLGENGEKDIRYKLRNVEYEEK